MGLGSGRGACTRRRGNMPSNGKNRAMRRLRAGTWRLRHRLRRADVRSQLFLWPVAVVIGIVTGYAVILFRIAISWPRA